jgi:hypothetical protein
VRDRAAAARSPAGPTGVARPLPARTWIGLIVICLSELGTLLRVEPFYSWHTPIAWTAYILSIDGIVWKRRGRSWLSDARSELAFLSVASVPLWLIFEAFNKYSIHNWYYVGLPESLPLRYVGYVWSFATISPAIFETGDLVASFRHPRRTFPSSARIPLGAAGWTSVIAGTLMLAWPIAFPSPYLAAPVWLGFIFALDPINASAGAESIRRDLREGRRDRLINLLIAGLVCGLLWELWNYWAGAKWKYTVPIFPDVKLFEMPVAGFGGFPPFAVECFVMYVAVRQLMWRGARCPISI